MFRTSSKAFGFATALSFAFPAVAQDPAERMLTPAQVGSDIAIAQEAYSRVHPGYTRYAEAATLAASWQALTDQATQDGGMTVGELYLGVQRVLALIRCDHTKAELPPALADWRDTNPVYLPFRWEMVEGRGLVSNAEGIAGLGYGDEIVAIDGRPLGEMVDAILPLIAVDGQTDWARFGEVPTSFEFKGGALDHFGALIWGNPVRSRITVRSADGGESTSEVERIPYGEWRALFDDEASDFADAVYFERISDTAGYLRIDSFVNYRRPVDPGTLYDPIFNAMRDEERGTLILDLRNNGGGSDDAADALLARLIAEPYRPVSDTRVATIDLDGLRENLTTWDERALYPDPRAFTANEDGTWSLIPGIFGGDPVLQPANNAFTGALLILTSTANSSGSTNIIARLNGLGRAILIGERTGGSAEGPTSGILFTVTLPESDIRTRLPLLRTYNNVPSFEAGLGVAPDNAAPQTVESFRAQRDPAIEAALEILMNAD
ncbi:S41 family peptidase [Maricaulis sp. MIT060901]|uniref:S41 family peptidase n=1 Tax=Maricaulis sp. MIT060901 TaxID=3096993 RepID=UPI00399ABE33